MRRTPIRLSDGRELIYFDSDGTPNRSAVDRRGLEPGGTQQGTMRRDPFTGEWVSIAGHRQTRIFLPNAAECPICPSTPDNLSEIPEADYEVVVFENRFPSFLVGEEFADAEELHDWDAEIPAHGRCEVVTFTSDHGGSVASLDSARMLLVMQAWVDRTRELSALPGIRSVFVFENRGAEVGVTLHHPHGQIYAYPYLPAFVSTLLSRAADYRARTGGSLLDAVVAREISDGRRIVAANDDWVAFVPFASRWPYEVQIHPIAHCTSLAELTDAQQQSFAEMFPRLVRALDSIFGMPFPYMAGWTQVPAHASAEEIDNSRLFLRLISNRRAADKLKYLAGSESLMGAFINDVTPETAAAQIRESWERSDRG